MKNVEKKIWDKYEAQPKINYALTLDAYLNEVFEIYFSYYKVCKKDMIILYNAIRKIVKDTPKLLQKSGVMKGKIVFKDAEHNIHAFDSSDDFKEMFEDFYVEAEKELAKRKHIWNEI